MIALAEIEVGEEPDHRYTPRRGDTLKREGWRAVHPAFEDIPRGATVMLVTVVPHPQRARFAWAVWARPATKLGTALRDFHAGEMIRPSELGADIAPQDAKTGR